MTPLSLTDAANEGLGLTLPRHAPARVLRGHARRRSSHRSRATDLLFMTVDSRGEAVKTTELFILVHFYSICIIAKRCLRERIQACKPAPNGMEARRPRG